MILEVKAALHSLETLSPLIKMSFTMKRKPQLYPYNIMYFIILIIVNMYSEPISLLSDEISWSCDVMHEKVDGSYEQPRSCRCDGLLKVLGEAAVAV